MTPRPQGWRRRIVDIALAAWLAAGCAAYAGFIDLPGLPRWLDTAAFWMAAAGNALWHGVARPWLASRQTEVGTQEQEGGDPAR